MKKVRVSFTPEFQPSPVTYWVHVNRDGDSWRDATVYEPPLPDPVPGKGWARLSVEFNGVVLEFASGHEVEHVIEVLSTNPLPTTRSLSRLRGSPKGPNSHWLSRLPAKAKSWKFRQQLVAHLSKAKETFETSDRLPSFRRS